MIIFLRNLVLFSELPGVSAPGEGSVMYAGTYSLWERIGIPSLADWNLAFPFSPSDFSGGEVYEFALYHLLDTEGVGLEFKPEFVEVGE